MAVMEEQIGNHVVFTPIFQDCADCVRITLRFFHGLVDQLFGS